MTDVLLASAFFIKNDAKQLEKMRPYPPLGTLHAASFLRENGYRVALFDAMLSPGIEEFEELLNELNPNFVAFYEDQFNFLNKMCLNHVRESICEMAALARQSGAEVIAAGADITDEPSAYFAKGIDYIIAGEADHTILELLAVLTDKSDTQLNNIPGLILPDETTDHGIRYTPKRPTEPQLDVFPIPAWDLIDGHRYREAWTNAHGYFSLNMMTSRGCPFHCNWCAKPIWGQQYAIRSAERVAEEMAHIKKLYNPDHIWFADDIFGLSPKWVPIFADAVESRNAQTPFMVQSRVDLMTEKAVAGLARAGCNEVWVGVESGSQKILDAMDKGLQLPMVPVVRQRLADAGIKTCYFIQLGYPGETFEDILATISLVRETLPDDIGVSVSYPLPGTKFHDRVKAELRNKYHWEDSNDLDIMFHGTYQSSFYQKLHRLLHRDLDLRIELRDAGPEKAGIAQQLDELEKEWKLWADSEPLNRNRHPTLIDNSENKNDEGSIVLLDTLNT